MISDSMCKFKKALFDRGEYKDLMSVSAIFSQVMYRYYYIFSKGGYTEWVKTEAEKNGVQLLGLDDLFL